MSDFFKNNLVYLRELNNENQLQTATALGLSRSTYANYETGENEPKTSTLMKIIGHFNVSFENLMLLDLKNVHLNKKADKKNKDKNVHLNVHPSVHLNAENQVNEETPVRYLTAKNALATSPIQVTPNTDEMKQVPITDISVAAGTGVFNSDYIENLEYMCFPNHMLKKNATYLTVRIKGGSMAPTLQDGGYMAIRFIEPAKWASIGDERIYVVADKEGKSYLKRVKNRFKQGFIVLMSDNPDKATYGNFNLQHDEIVSIWEAEIYISHKMPNIHAQYYSRLQQLEDRMDEIAGMVKHK